MPGLGGAMPWDGIIPNRGIIAMRDAGGITAVPISIHYPSGPTRTSIHLEFDEICSGELLWNFIILSVNTGERTSTGFEGGGPQI